LVTVGQRLRARGRSTDGDDSPRGSGTHVDVDAEIEAKGATRLMGPFMGPMMRRTFSKRPAQLAAGVAAMQKS
jgi:hypothetical protein